jgi:hypothetical protein
MVCDINRITKNEWLEKNYTMRFIICILHKNKLNYQVMEDDIGKIYSMHGEDECVYGFGGNAERKGIYRKA